MNKLIKIMLKIIKYIFYLVISVIFLLFLGVAWLIITDDGTCRYKSASTIWYEINFRESVGPSGKSSFYISKPYDSYHFIEYVTCDTNNRHDLKHCRIVDRRAESKNVFLNLYANKERERLFILVEDEPICFEGSGISLYETLITTEDGTVYTATEPPSITYSGQNEEAFKVHLEQPTGEFKADYTFHVHWMDPEDFAALKEEKLAEINAM